KKTKMKKINILCVCLASFLFLVVLGSSANAVEDNDPPTITNLEISPTTIDTSSENQEVTFTFTVEDDENGVGFCPYSVEGCPQELNSSLISFHLFPLIGTQGELISSQGITKISGDEYHGEYSKTITIRAGRTAGIWQIASRNGTCAVIDQLGNARYYTDDYDEEDNYSLMSSISTSSGFIVTNVAENTEVEIDREWTLESSTASATFPEGTVVTKKEGGSFAFYQMVNQEVSIDEVPVDDEPEGDVVKTLKFGIPNIGLEFSEPVEISLNVGSEYNGDVLQISSLEEGEDSWIREETCTVEGGMCTFTVTHASYFVATVGPSPVYRFYSPTGKSHFFTTSESEKNRIIANYSADWNYEGVAYYAYSSSDTGLTPIYRFYSPTGKSHFFTKSESEKNNVIANYSNDWNYEGVAYYAYNSSDTGLNPTYRFYSPTGRSHFFTTSESEKNRIISNYSADWNYEGVAWYVPEN
ncbi:MAG: hypothetical protein PF549_02010, partial [Patescibacteria group bacterium]|nr:hypothetical protein [Patescibacteria group bacterium]